MTNVCLDVKGEAGPLIEVGKARHASADARVGRSFLRF